VRARVLAGAVCLVVAATACTATASDEAADPTGTQPSSATTAVRPDGPAADLTEKVTGGGAPFVGSARTVDLAAADYVEQEFVAAGEATSYVPDGPLTEDGNWSFTQDTTAPYRTRVLVRRPADPATAGGNVVVEWLNVSGGLDADVVWSNLHEEITRRGDTWVGVSAQRIGIEGGPVLVRAPGAEDIVGKGLKVLDPDRYGTLQHPGDGYAFDIFTQVARAVRAGAADPDGAPPEHVVAAGQSQSALALTTYYDGVQPLTRAFDGFFVHSRAFVALPLVGPGQYADLAGGFGAGPVRFRTDLDAPVMNLQAESDVIGVLDSAAVRQPDSDRFRLWEVAGTAHADAHTVGATAERLDCDLPINDGPLHVVAKAAYRGLVDWVRTGDPPPEAPRLELTADPEPAIARDPDGIALGGLRTPPVDVPAQVLSSRTGPDPSLFCLLLGSTLPLPADRLAALHPTRVVYEQDYEAATDDTIAAGFALAEDREALLGFARPSLVTG
jgi:hypothetical protein